MSKPTFAMRREKDIIAALNKHSRKLIALLEDMDPPDYLYMKTLIHWSKTKTSVIDGFDRPSFLLHEVLSSFGATHECMRDGLLENGKRTVHAPRPKGIAPDAPPLAITISVETMIPIDANAKYGEEDTRVPSFPVLLLAGRTATGKFIHRLMPIATAKDTGEKRFLFPGAMPPAAFAAKMEWAQQTTTDFLRPFFDGYQEGNPKGNFAVL